MNSSKREEETETSQPKVKSVSASILSEFFDELSKEESLTDLVPGFRKIILDESNFSEPAIRAALFPDTP